MRGGRKAISVSPLPPPSHDADVRVEARELIDAGDKIVVIGRTRATARGSGLQLENDVALVWTVRGGKLVRNNEVFMDRREALEAAGLSE